MLLFKPVCILIKHVVTNDVVRHSPCVYLYLVCTTCYQSAFLLNQGYIGIILLYRFS